MNNDDLVDFYKYKLDQLRGEVNGALIIIERHLSTMTAAMMSDYSSKDDVVAERILDIEIQVRRLRSVCKSPR